MNSVFSAVLITLLVLVVSWIMIFGTAGWLLAKRRGFPPPGGFLVAAFFGPLGLCFIYWKSRRNQKSSDTFRKPPLSSPPPSSSPTLDDFSSI